MQYPKFFDAIEKITLKDDLSDFLGTFEDGIVEFSYLDVVKYDPSNIQGDPKIDDLMQKMVLNKATEVEKKEFKECWQQRVENILKNKDKVITIL